MPTYTAAQLAEAVGWPEDLTRRFFRALGFPDAGEEIRYTQGDLQLLRTVTDAVEGSEVDLGTAVRLARAVGQNVARMSDWQVAAIVSRVEALGHGGTDPETRHKVAERLAEQLSDALQAVLVHSWRRHLDDALARLDADRDVDEQVGQVVTAGFADLVAFSALSNELDSNRLGELVEIFEARCGDVVAAHEGRMIKTLGDSVLFVHDDADRAMDIACALVEVIGRDGRLPDLRIGLATGRVVTRLGDIFGPPVNLAARLTSLARPNRVIIDDATLDRLRPGEYDARRLTARAVRGFGLVEPITVRRRR